MIVQFVCLYHAVHYAGSLCFSIENRWKPLATRPVLLLGPSEGFLGLSDFLLWYGLKVNYALHM